MIAGIKPEISKEKLWQFMFAISPLMTANDQHGLGYAAMGREGIWGERWLRPVDAWKYRKEWTSEDEIAKEKFKGTLQAEPRFNLFGNADPSHTSAITLHARMATNEKCIANTHPFVRDKLSLIHNGVISNTHELENITSTNDSECILNSYHKHDVVNNPDNIAKVAKDIHGYYACGVLSTNAEGKNHLDIFRNATAQLSAYYVKELDAVVFCTRSEMIRDACKQLKWSYGNTFTFKDDVMIRIDCETGTPISTHKFTPKSSYTNNYYGNGYSDGHGTWNKLPNGEWAKTYAEENKASTATTGGTLIEKKSPELKIVKALSQEVIEEARTSLRSQRRTGNTCGSNALEMTEEEKMKDPFYYRADYAEYMQ